MSVDNELACTIRAMRPFVPAKDFDLSRRFYEEVGFASRPLGDALIEMSLGQHSFLLQRYYVAAWAGNFVMHLRVTDLDRWWRRISARDLGVRYNVENPRAPKLESWGCGLPICSILRECSGILPKCPSDEECDDLRRPAR